MISREYTLEGLVQGVGFRPFIHTLASQRKLTGWVKNVNGFVHIVVQGDEKLIHDFEIRMIKDAPQASKPSIFSRCNIPAQPLKDFRILSSESDHSSNASAGVHLPADRYCCPDCQWELLNDDNPRYRYAFINCTQCGPRYTIIDALPYDRPATAMATFELCPTCATEYADPNDRRFHAEPLACPECGPQLSYHNRKQAGMENPLQSASLDIVSGKVLAVKGIGGFHLVCDARDEAAITRLRQLKPRPDKPFAVMLLPEHLRDYCEPTNAHVQALRSAVRPVVLCPKKPNMPLPKSIAPGLNEIGIIYPYSPLHYLLLDKLQRPLIVTSANISGEPVFTDSEAIATRLSHVVEGVLDHNRPIRRPADDSVVHIQNEEAHTLRIGRGFAPLELRNPYPLESDKTLLATGAQSKNTVCLSYADRLLVSPHIADMESLRSQEIFAQVVKDFSHLYQREINQLTHDAHPEYFTSHWAAEQKLPCTPVWHHHAHASSLYAQSGEDDLDPDENIIAFTWDGVGLGEDGQLWGGEALYGKPGSWQRLISLKPFKLPGGDAAAREPWRIADSLRLHCALPAKSQDPLLVNMWEKGVNSPFSSAVGRFLDGCAAMLNICHTATYEGQAPMLLAALAEQNDSEKYIDLPIVEHQVIWLGLIKWLEKKPHEPDFAARVIHNTLAHSLLKQALLISQETGCKVVGISGGVFQNRLLVEDITQRLSMRGLRLHHPTAIPVNDGGLCIGQAVETAAQLRNNLASTHSEPTEMQNELVTG